MASEGCGWAGTFTVNILGEEVSAASAMTLCDAPELKSLTDCKADLLPGHFTLCMSIDMS